MSKKSESFILKIEEMRANNWSNDKIITDGALILGEEFSFFAKEYFRFEEQKSKAPKLHYDWPVINPPPTFGPVDNHPANFKYFLDFYNIEFARLFDNVIIFWDDKWQLYEEKHRTSIHSNLLDKAGEFYCSKDNQRDFITHFSYESKVDWLKDFAYQKPWDGKDHILSLYQTLNSKAEDREFELLLFKKFIHGYISLILDIPIYQQPARSELMLILQGPQGIGKTQWSRKLVPKAPINIFHEGTIDPKNKDHVLLKSRVALWIASEFEESLNKYDIGAFKDFLTLGEATIRKAYAEKETQLRSVCSFIGSTNTSGFLPPGDEHRRFFVIETDKVDYTHTVDLQQVFAQVIVERENGFENWMNSQERAANYQRLQKWVKTDSLQEFLSEYTVSNKHLMSHDKLWSAYITFCKEYQIAQAQPASFKQRLKELGYYQQYNKTEKQWFWNIDFKTQ